MLNKVMIIGRLGQDPELKYTAGGTPMTSLNVATDDNYTDKDGNKVARTEWHRVKVFQRLAENCANYLGKGSLVYIEGSLQTRKWTDQQGQDRYMTEIIAQRVQFLDRKGEGRGESRGEGGFDKSRGGGGFRKQAGGGNEDMGPAFPSEAASRMDDMPF